MASGLIHKSARGNLCNMADRGEQDILLFHSQVGPCLCARVQRGSSEAVRYASTGNRHAPSFFLYSSSPVLEGVAEAALDCAHWTSTF